MNEQASTGLLSVVFDGETKLVGYRVHYSAQDECWIGVAVDYYNISAHGDTQQEAVEELRKATQLAVDVSADCESHSSTLDVDHD